MVYQACISPMEHNNDEERAYIGIYAGNKDCITTDIFSPICDWKAKPLYLNIFGTLKIRG